MQYQYLQPLPEQESGSTLIGHGLLFDEELIKEANRRTYHAVFNGSLDFTARTALDIDCALDAIYQMHNRDDRPCRKSIRSMSVGDLIMILGRVFIVDRIGFAELIGSNIPNIDNPEPVVD